MNGSPSDPPESIARTDLPRLLIGLMVGSLAVVAGQAVVYLGNHAVTSLIIGVAVLGMAIGAFVANRAAAAGHPRAALIIACGGTFAAAITCVLADPRVMTASTFAALLAVALAMPFVSPRQLRAFAAAGGAIVVVIAACAVFVDLFPRSYTLASNVSLVFATGVAAAITLNWLLRFHDRLLTLVGGLHNAREDLEIQVTQRTRELAAELEHARMLEHELRQARERLVNTLEEERRRIRRDLHDGLGPQLAALILKLDAARRLAGPAETLPGGLAAQLAEMKQQTQSAIADVRRVVYGLRPPVLDEMGLAAAIRHHAQQFSAGDGARFDVLAADGLPALPAALEVALYRIALEAMTNVHRHAQARLCAVHIAREPSLASGESIIITVEDDGQGMPAEARPGVGLQSMRERAAELGGTCEIEHLAPGTRITARIPLPQRPSQP